MMSGAMERPMPTMPLRPFGSTGLSVTPIGLGLAALGRPAYIDLGRGDDLGADRGVDVMRSRAHAVLDAAFALGVRYVDAARSYGRAEEFLSGWIAVHPSETTELTIGSKWGYTYTGDWRMDALEQEVKDHSLATLRRQIGESRALLDGHLDLYQIHSATLESGVLEDRAVLGELIAIRAGGLFVGLTVSGPRQAETIRRALAVDVDGMSPFAAVQATWNLLEPSAGAALEEAHAAGWGVIVKEALANGRLTDRGADGRAGALGDVTDEHRVSADAAAIAAVLANPWADVVLSGAVTEAQLRSNARALDVDLGAEELDRLRDLAIAPDDYWRQRARLPWS
jgi:aryl-alcohol dehydrogenase-like predicted oxidoreductase